MLQVPVRSDVFLPLNTYVSNKHRVQLTLRGHDGASYQVLSKRTPTPFPNFLEAVLL